MKLAGKKICSYCGHRNPATATLCQSCRKKILITKYEIVCDEGQKFAIGDESGVKIHGLDFERARHLVSLLNGIDEGSEVA